MQRLYYPLHFARSAALVHNKSSDVVSVRTGNDVVATEGVPAPSNDYRFDEDWFAALFDGSLDGASINTFIGNSVSQRGTGLRDSLGSQIWHSALRCGLVPANQESLHGC
jgi:hypothetical protein